MILARPVLTACLMFALTPVASAQQQASPAASPAAPAAPNLEKGKASNLDEEKREKWIRDTREDIEKTKAELARMDKA